MPVEVDPLTRLSRSCDPDAALNPGDPRYVDLSAARGEPGNSWRVRLARALRQSGRPQTHLVAGFLGDGKTTELTRLHEELMHKEPRMAVVYVDSSKYINAYDYSFNQVLLAVISETGQQLRQAPYFIEMRPNYLSRKITEISSALASNLRMSKITASAGGDSLKVASEILIEARDSDSIRKVLSDALRGDHTNLSREFAEIIGREVRPQLRQQGYQDLVIIIDWLEKVIDTPMKDQTIGMHKALFFHHAQGFKSWDAHVVMTVPIDLVYSAEEEVLRDLYGCEPIVINQVGVADCVGSAIKEIARAKMHELLRLRAEAAPDGALAYNTVFEDEKLADEVIRYSGGHLRSLMLLMRQCCSFSDRLPITRTNVDAARREERMAASRRVEHDWFPLLAQVHKTGQIRRDADHFRMLRTLCVLEYANGEPKYAVDPPITELEAFRKALADIQTVK